MAERQPNAPTHRAYSVIKREGQDDYWLNIGLVFPHKDGNGFNLILQAFTLDGKIVCRQIQEEEAEQPETPTRGKQDAPRGGQGKRRRLRTRRASGNSMMPSGWRSPVEGSW